MVLMSRWTQALRSGVGAWRARGCRPARLEHDGLRHHAVAHHAGLHLALAQETRYVALAMPARPLRPPANALGVAIRDRRAELTQNEVAAALALQPSTLSRIESGAHAPSTETALVLARWLGWTVEAVLAAAKMPVGQK